MHTDKQMAWLPLDSSGNGDKILHIKIDGRWIPYDRSALRVSDTVIGGVPTSRGFRTMQALLKQGYELVKADAAMRSSAHFADCSEVNEWS